MLSLCPVIWCDMPLVPLGMLTGDVVLGCEVTLERELCPVAVMP